MELNRIFMRFFIMLLGIEMKSDVFGRIEKMKKIPQKFRKTRVRVMNDL